MKDENKKENVEAGENKKHGGKKMETKEPYTPFKSTEDFKIAFPVLRNLEGRFLGLFLRCLDEETIKLMKRLNKKAEAFAKSARKELGNKICYDEYAFEPLCHTCKYLKNGSFGFYCEKYPDMGQRWQGDKPGIPASLTNPQSISSQWYWCIRECLDFKHIEIK